MIVCVRKRGCVCVSHCAMRWLQHVFCRTCKEEYHDGDCISKEEMAQKMADDVSVYVQRNQYHRTVWLVLTRDGCSRGQTYQTYNCT